MIKNISSLKFLTLVISLSLESSLWADVFDNLKLESEPVEETTIKIRSSKTLLKPSNTSSASTRDLNFQKTFPVTSINPQQLTGLLLSNPGFVQNSNNQIHPRGEHAATSIFIQGFQLGGVSQGRFGALIDPQALQSLDVMTGAFAAEYAGGAGVLDATIRSGTADAFKKIEIGGGNFDTSMGSFSFGGQVSPLGCESNSLKLAYFVSGTDRRTANALEAPQPLAQTVHNDGKARTLLGRFDLLDPSSDRITLIINHAPAKTQIANRQGLPRRYAPFGQGYGFGGTLSRGEAEERGITDQDSAGQDIYQKDENNFGVLQWRHAFSENTNSRLSVGIDQSVLDTLNNNPDVNLNQLSMDNSIEYNPTVKREAIHRQFSGSVTTIAEDHTIKVGGLYMAEQMHDSYQILPASELALNALAATDSRLSPSGNIQLDGTGDPVLDSQGSPVFILDNNAASPTLRVRGRGHYTALYLQDNWKMTDKLTVNYGGRFDSYRHNQNLSRKGVDTQQFSPRINLSYAISQNLLARTSYNRLFIEPPLAQGAILGTAIKPERVNQYEMSLEKQFFQNQRAKIAYYYKQITNQVDTGLLIPSTQLGLFTSVNLDSARVRGLEFSYDLLASNNVGTSAYLAYAYSVARPYGFDNTGEAVPRYNDHDQRHTLSTGLAYVFTNGALVGSDLYYGSGVASSALSENGPRKSRTRVNLSLASSPKMLFNHGGLKLVATNIFDEKHHINFNSAFSGTRFEQGRAIMLYSFFNF